MTHSYHQTDLKPGVPADRSSGAIMFPSQIGYWAAVPPRQVLLTLDMDGKEQFSELAEQVKQTLSIPVEITTR